MTPLTALRERQTAILTPRDVRPASGERRILTVVRWPLGGIRTHIVYTYPELARAGYRFTFVGPDNESLRTFAASLSQVPGCEFIGVETRGMRCPLWRTVRKLVRQNRFGLIHSHGLTAAVHAVAGNFGAGLPHLTTVHDVFRPDQFPGWKGWLKRWLLARLLCRISTIAAVSEDVRSNLLEYLPALGRGRGRLLAISNGIDTHRYREQLEPVSTELRRRLELTPDTILLGFLGRFMEQKGFTTLLQALEILRREGSPRRFHLTAVGSGDRRGRYEEEIARRGLAGCVSVLDFIPDVLPVLRQFDLLVVPSLWEAGPLVPMEAMCAGVPVLGSDCIGLREVLHATPSRQFPAGDAGALASALRQALVSPWTDEARAFSRRAQARFDSRQYALQFLVEFDRLFVSCVSRRMVPR